MHKIQWVIRTAEGTRNLTEAERLVVDREDASGDWHVHSSATRRGRRNRFEERARAAFDAADAALMHGVPDPAERERLTAWMMENHPNICNAEYAAYLDKLGAPIRSAIQPVEAV